MKIVGIMEQNEIKEMVRKVQEELRPTDAIQKERDRLCIGNNGMNTSGLIMEDRRPQTGKYLVYISIDWLEELFLGMDIRGNREAQEKFVDELQKSLTDFIMNRKDGIYVSWEWKGSDGCTHRAIDMQPVLTSDTAPLFLTEEWWQMLKETLKTKD